MEDSQKNGAAEGKEEIPSDSAAELPAAEPSAETAPQSAEQTGTSLPPPEAPVTGLTALSVPPLQPHATAPDAPEATTIDTDLTPILDPPNGLAISTAEHFQSHLNLPEETALFSEDDPFTQTLEHSQIGDNDYDDLSEGKNIQAFAKLEFDDGEFYMTTYAVELGRDVRVPREPQPLDLAPQPDLPIHRSKKRSWHSGHSSRSRKRSRGHGNHTSSVVSESGGIIGVDLPGQGEKETEKVKPMNAESASSSSQYLSRKSSFAGPKKDYNRETRELENWLEQHTGNKAGDDANVDQMPAADKIPLIPIHPPANANGIATGHQGISRKHVRIFFNFAEHVFQVTFFGRNGGFVDDQWYASAETVTLVSGSIIQLKGVCIKFTLPEVPDGETGAEDGDFAESSGFHFGGRTGSEMYDSEESEENTYRRSLGGGSPVFKSEEDVSDEEEEDEQEDEEEEPEPELPRRRGKGKPQAEPEEEPEAPRPKRKGPGRPPKNGIMSKREQAQQAREARENAKAKADGKTTSAQGRGKGKTAKARELEASHLQPNGKRKYTKRKKAVDAEAAPTNLEETEQDESVPPETTSKPAKEKKPIKPPRSPSPVFNEAELTPEQLAKPQSSYVVLIHEALTNSKTGQMSLPQIYRAIERRYPFFKIRVQTQGWQSSVRHNLSQHPAFTKIERDGKGWMWGLVPSVSIEKEKKRRPSPPTVPQQNYQYPNHQARYPQHPHPYPYPNIPNPGQNNLPFPYSVPPMPFPPQLGPNGIPTPFARPQAESTYRSPYDSNPDSAPAPAPTSSTPQAQAQAPPKPPNPLNINGHYHTPPTTQQPPSHQSQSQSQPQPLTQQHQQQPHPTAPTPPAARYPPDLLTRVSAYKTALIKSLDHIPDPESLVTAVINHKLYGHPLKANAEPGSDAAAILKPLEDIILAGAQGSTSAPAAAGSTSTTAAAGGGGSVGTTQPSRLPPPPASTPLPAAAVATPLPAADSATATAGNGLASKEGGDTVAGKAADIARKIQTEKG